MRSGMLGEEMCGAAVSMAHHEHLHVHGFEVAQCIQQRLTFYCCRCIKVQVQHIRRQPFGRHLECGAGAGTVFEKQVADHLAMQQWHSLHSTLGDAGKGFGGIEYIRQYAAVEAVNRQEMFESAFSVELEIGLFHDSLPRASGACTISLIKRSMAFVSW